MAGTLSSPRVLGHLYPCWHSPLHAATAQGPPGPQRLSPSVFIYHLPLTPFLRALSGQLMVPASFPSFPQRALTASSALSLGGLSITPFLSVKPLVCLLLGQETTSSPLCFPHPHGAKTLQLGLAGWPRFCGGINAPGTLGFLGCRCPWMWPPSAPCPHAAVAGGLAGTDAVTHRWLPGPLSWPAVLGEHQDSPKTELGGRWTQHQSLPCS